MVTPPARLVLAAYTSFGARGRKGTPTYYLVKEAWKRGYVRQVIAVSKSRCQYEFDLQLVNTLPGESRLTSSLSKIKEKVWAGFPSRWLGEVIFDHYAAAKLPRQSGVLVMTPRLVKTAQVARRMGYRLLSYAGQAHPEHLLKQIQAENSAFSLKSAKQHRSRGWEMARFAAHLASSDYILTISDFAKDTYVQAGFPREKIFVAPLGVDLRRFHATPPPKERSFTCLFVAHVAGAIAVLKGLPYLLQAWTELGLQNARLLVCGKMGPEAQELIQRSAGKLGTVEFTGPVSDPETYFRQASVFVFPSIAEGFGKVVLEAMASGRPVITTPVPKPVVRDGLDGFYIAPRDVAALKDRILYFYQQPEEVCRMGANASEQAHRFTWERFSVQVADIVAEVAAK
jgi:glycosyltransferase involved in cell wall biosynthesis